MIPLTNHDFQWGRSEVVIIYPDIYTYIYIYVYNYIYMAVRQNLVPLVNIKIAGKWMFIPLKMVLIGIDPYIYWSGQLVVVTYFRMIILHPFLPKRSGSSDQDGEVLSEQISTEGPGRPQSPWKMCVCVFFFKGNCDFKEKKYRFRLTLWFLTMF